MEITMCDDFLGHCGGCAPPLKSECRKMSFTRTVGLRTYKTSRAGLCIYVLVSNSLGYVCQKSPKITKIK